MATSSEYLEYVRERVERFGALREKKMFGDYILYLNEKPVFLICDNTVYVKCLSAIAPAMQDSPIGAPYEGAKPRQLLITREQWEQMRNGTYAPPAPPVEDELP